jgi:predicted flavoprotein YhiN
VEKNPKLKAILERGADVLQKVRISGGGRCNAHACFEPNELVKYYPRGEKNCADLSINFLLVTPSNGLKTWRRTKN